MAAPHRPVMLAEVLEALQPGEGGRFADLTLGAGGHAAALLAAGDEVELLGLDLDPDALELAAGVLAPFGGRAVLAQAGSDELGPRLAALGWDGVDGVLLDLGVSSMQLDQAGRGFSFRADAPLDMRMSAQGPSAAEVIDGLDQRELAALLARLGEEPQAKRVARAIKAEGRAGGAWTTGRLAAAVERALGPAAAHKRGHHPATRTFLALRLAVNDELGRLERFLEGAPGWLRPGGRLAVISYHSLEDRLVKRAMRAWADPCTCPPELGACLCGRRPLAVLPRKKALTPGQAEVAANPRARSARLRVAVRTQEAA